MKKRLGIFVLYDADGIIDDYRVYIIKELKKVVSRLVVTVNGDLTYESQAVVREYTDDLWFRDDSGYDATAIKESLYVYLGDDCLKEYDELIWLNDSCYGPFVSFEVMIDRMERVKCDFWGITAQDPVVNGFSKEKLPEEYLPRHIQPYVGVVREKMFHSNEFKEFWMRLPVITSYEDAVINYELAFTVFFEERGFIGESYAKGIEEIEDIWIMNYPFSMLKNEMTFLKRKCFSRDFYNKLIHPEVMNTRELLKYIEENTDYPTEYIWKNIIRNQKTNDVLDNLNLRFICDDKVNVDSFVKELFEHYQYIGAVVYIENDCNKLFTRAEIKNSINDQNYEDKLKSCGYCLAYVKKCRDMINHFESTYEKCISYVDKRARGSSVWQEYTWRTILLEDYILSKNKLYIYGAGYYAEKIIGYIKENHWENKVLGFVVSDGHKSKETMEGYPILELSELKISDNNEEGIIIAVSNNASIISALNKNGMQDKWMNLLW